MIVVLYFNECVNYFIRPVWFQVQLLKKKGINT